MGTLLGVPMNIGVLLQNSALLAAVSAFLLPSFVNDERRPGACWAAPVCCVAVVVGLGRFAPIGHMDIWAGSALLLPEYRWLIDGIDGDGANSPAADSLSWNPHKWLGTVLDCSLLYVRDPELLIRVMSTAPSYLRSTADAVVEYRDWGIPLGRRFRALKLWFHLRLDGVPAIQARLRRDLLNARRLADVVTAEPGWRVLAPVQLQTVCLRHEPPGLVAADGTVLAGEALDRHTLAWADALNASGVGFVSPAVLNGRWMVRISIGVESTEWDDVAAVWAAARAEAARASAVL
jgi:aromatic-L-amino-acid decarboxylase